MNLKHLLLSIHSVRDRVLSSRSLRSRLMMALALAAGLAGVLPAGVAHAGQPTKWVAGELLVGYRAGAIPTKTEAAFRSLGVSVVQDIGPLRIVRVRIPGPLLDVTAWLLRLLPEVKSVEKNYIFDPVLSPNDPQYVSQWHLPQILAPQAWDVTQGSAGAVIAIVDSGVDPYHPDLASKLIPGYNTYSNTTNTADQYGHGTEVAGAAGALSNNAEGIAGVAGLSPIMPVRVTDATGRATSASIASGIVWAADHGARVINLSFNSVAGNATIRTAAEYAYNHGGLVVAASGNCGCVDATAENPFILSVSATDETDSVAYFSSTGPYVDISAPGTNILTTVMGGLYFSDSGTSLSSPIVAGVAALMFSANPALSPGLVTILLESTAADFGATGYDQGYGYGRVNAFAAVTAAASYTPPADTTAPAVSLVSPTDGATVSGTVVVDASASDNVGVVKVDLNVDGVFFATDVTAPYSFVWDTTLLSNGAHTLQVIATDAAGNNGSTALMTVTVSNIPPDTTAPSVAISAPVAGATVSGMTTVSANASDNVGVVKVNFYLDGVLKATDTTTPYSFVWNTTTASNGSHTLQAIAADAAGNSSSTVTMSVTVSNIPPDVTPPTVAISSPASGATVSGTTTVSASASDNVGVVKVDFYVDGVLKATDTTAPYSFTWNTTTASNGSHTLQAIATDAAANSASTANMTVTVSNVVPDTTPPSVSISAPAASAIVFGTTTITASASDNVGVVKVSFYVDGVLKGTDTTAPYSYAWNTSTYSKGAHTLQVVAADAAGNTASATIPITINTAPIAANDSFIAPVRPNSSYTAQVFAVLANDSDPDGSLNVASVKIGTSPNKGGTVTVNANGTVSYTPKRSYVGVETFTYTAKDNVGVASNTATVTVTVQ